MGFFVYLNILSLSDGLVLLCVLFSHPLDSGVVSGFKLSLGNIYDIFTNAAGLFFGQIERFCQGVGVCDELLVPIELL